MLIRLRLALLAVLLVLGWGPLAACSSSAAAPTAPTVAEIRTALMTHASAVLHRDRSAFLAGVDPDSRASAFRSRQTGEIDNLVKLPVIRWSYTVVARTDDAAAEKAATTRLGAPATIVQLTLQFALARVDAAPASHELRWTFVKRHGKVVAAADDDLADVGGASWPGPWDFGPLQVVHGTHSLVLGHAADARLLPQIAAVTDAAVPAVTAVWGDDWSQYVEVLVPDTSAELTAALGPDASVSGEVAAAAENDGLDARSGKVVGQRVVVSPRPFTSLSPLGRQITFRHELTHVASAAVTGVGSPRWLVEGFAGYVGNLGSGQSVPVAAAELRHQLQTGPVPAGLPDDAAFDTASTSAAAYEQAWLACRFIAGRVGRAGLITFYKQVGTADTDPDTAVRLALRDVLHLTPGQFVRQWQDYLERQLR